MTQTDRASVRVTIDGRALEVPPGTLIIRAAEQLGITIPRFCDHRLLAPVAACRQCLVEVEGQRKPVASCAQAVADGMDVKTQLSSALARDAQRSNLEFLLINHPLDCPMCDKGGECPLQDQTLANGPGETRFVEAKRRFAKPIKISETVLLDRDRCVQCARCTRFASEIAGDPFIELFERGALEQVAIFADQGFDSYFSGNVVQICPVGALTSPSYRFQARPFDLTSTDGICNHCAAGCNLRIDSRRGLVTRRLARDNDEVNEAWNCDRGRYGFAAEQSAARLTVPMAGRPDGALVTASWRAAVRGAAARLGELGGSVGVLVGGHLTDEDAYALQKLARVGLGTNNVDARPWAPGPGEVATLARIAGSGPDEVPAGPRYADLDAAGTIVVVELDPHEESPILYLRLRKAALRSGARVIAVGSRTGRFGGFATVVPATPGAGVVDAVEAVARDGGPAGDPIASDRPVVVLAGWRAGPSGALPAAADLAARFGTSLGWVPRRAGDRGALDAGAWPELLPGGRSAADPVARRKLAERWGADLPAIPGLRTREMLEAAAEGRLAGLVLAGVDLVRDVGPRALAEAALRRAFVVAIDHGLTGTTRSADVLLPAMTNAEARGTYTDWEGRVQRHSPAVRPSGMALAVWELADQLGVGLGVPLGLTSYDQVAAETAALRRRPAPAADAGSAGQPPPAGDEDRARRRRLPRISLRPEKDLALVSYPLLLDAASLLDGATDLRRATLPSFVELHPHDAGRLGLPAGGLARADFGDGRTAELVVRTGAAVAPGCAFVPANQPDLALRELLGEVTGERVRLTPAGAAAA